MEDIFKKYLDNSQDCNTIKLELENSYPLEDLWDLAKQADYSDLRILQQQGLRIENVETNRKLLFDLIREVWDIAYSHGYHDAQADEGMGLSEMEG